MEHIQYLPQLASEVMKSYVNKENTEKVMFKVVKRREEEYVLRRMPERDRGEDRKPGGKTSVNIDQKVQSY